MAPHVPRHEHLQGENGHLRPHCRGAGPRGEEGDPPGRNPRIHLQARIQRPTKQKPPFGYEGDLKLTENG